MRRVVTAVLTLCLVIGLTAAPALAFEPFVGWPVLDETQAVSIQVPTSFKIATSSNKTYMAYFERNLVGGNKHMGVSRFTEGQFSGTVNLSDYTTYITQSQYGLTASHNIAVVVNPISSVRGSVGDLTYFRNDTGNLVRVAWDGYLDTSERPIGNQVWPGWSRSYQGIDIDPGHELRVNNGNREIFYALRSGVAPATPYWEPPRMTNASELGYPEPLVFEIPVGWETVAVYTLPASGLYYQYGTEGYPAIPSTRVVSIPVDAVEWVPGEMTFVVSASRGVTLPPQFFPFTVNYTGSAIPAKIHGINWGDVEPGADQGAVDGLRRNVQRVRDWLTNTLVSGGNTVARVYAAAFDKLAVGLQSVTGLDPGPVQDYTVGLRWESTWLDDYERFLQEAYDTAVSAGASGLAAQIEAHRGELASISSGGGGRWGAVSTDPGGSDPGGGDPGGSDPGGSDPWWNPLKLLGDLIGGLLDGLSAAVGLIGQAITALAGLLTGIGEVLGRVWGVLPGELTALAVAAVAVGIVLRVLGR